MPNPYMDALKKFNEGKTGWCVPRKGTADYAKMMSLITKPASKEKEYIVRGNKFAGKRTVFS